MEAFGMAARSRKIAEVPEPSTLARESAVQSLEDQLGSRAGHSFRTVAERLAMTMANRYTLSSSLALRPGRIDLDYAVTVSAPPRSDAIHRARGQGFRLLCR